MIRKWLQRFRRPRTVAVVRIVMDHAWGTPEERGKALATLSEAMDADLRAAGAERIVTRLTPRLETMFGKQLRSLGWRKADEAAR